MNPASLPRFTRHSLLLISTLAVLASASAQTAPEVLDPYVTTATRTAATPRTLGSAVAVLTPADLERQQITGVAQALNSVAGAPSAASGAPGAVTSVFLRGSNSNQTLFLVDGIRFSDPNTDYNVFLGGGSLLAIDTLEVVRGPQSTLYGGEAIGGVVAIRAQRGQGSPSSRVAAEAGTFGTVSGAVTAQGAVGASAFNFALQGGHTDNERADNELDTLNGAVRLDHTVNERVAVGGTLRWFHERFGDPGDRYTNDPNNTATEDNVLGTLFADVKLAEAWTSHVTLGGQDRHLISNNPAPNPPYLSPDQRTDVRNRRGVLDWQNTFAGLDRHRLTSGVTAEANHTRNDGFGDINHKQTLLAAFAQDEYSPIDDVYLTAGLRYDDFDTSGSATTGRATAAWLLAHRSVKLRASYGTGFRSPSFLDLYGRSAYYVGNPNLRPERSRGGDAGVDYYLPGNRGTLSASWFETSSDNLIDYDFSVYPGTVKNVAKARSRGVELSVQTAVADVLDARLAYTYLEAQDRARDVRLLRRPRHAFSTDLSHTFARTVTVGSGVTFAAAREDVDAATFATVDAEDYTVVRVYAAWRVTPRLELKARCENLLDERYEEVNGYPALGLRIFGGATLTF